MGPDFGYGGAEIDRMASRSSWDEEYGKIEAIDPAIAEVRGALKTGA